MSLPASRIKGVEGEAQFLSNEHSLPFSTYKYIHPHYISLSYLLYYPLSPVDLRGSQRDVVYLG
jgi:hypothetical protein